MLQRFVSTKLRDVQSFQSRKLLLGSLGAVAVIAGVVAKNTTEQLAKQPVLAARIPKILGPALFVGGWALTAYANAINAAGTMLYDNKTLMGAISAAAIVGSVIVMKKGKKEGKKINPIYPVLFAGGWISFAWAVAMRRTPIAMTANRFTKGMALGGAALILASMMAILPMQRKMCIVDGPGMPMFTLGWMLVIGAMARV